MSECERPLRGGRGLADHRLVLVQCLRKLLSPASCTSSRLTTTSTENVSCSAASGPNIGQSTFPYKYINAKYRNLSVLHLSEFTIDSMQFT